MQNIPIIVTRSNGNKEKLQSKIIERQDPLPSQFIYQQSHNQHIQNNRQKRISKFSKKYENFDRSDETTNKIRRANQSNRLATKLQKTEEEGQGKLTDTLILPFKNNSNAPQEELRVRIRRIQSTGAKRKLPKDFFSRSRSRSNRNKINQPTGLNQLKTIDNYGGKALNEKQQQLSFAENPMSQELQQSSSKTFNKTDCQEPMPASKKQQSMSVQQTIRFNEDIDEPIIETPKFKQKTNDYSSYTNTHTKMVENEHLSNKNNYREHIKMRSAPKNCANHIPDIVKLAKNGHITRKNVKFVYNPPPKPIKECRQSTGQKQADAKRQVNMMENTFSARQLQQIVFQKDETNLKPDKIDFLEVTHFQVPSNKFNKTSTNRINRRVRNLINHRVNKQIKQNSQGVNKVSGNEKALQFQESYANGFNALKQSNTRNV